MSILQLPLPIAANTGVTPNIKTMKVTDDLTTVTTAGYLDAQNLQGYTVSPEDEIHMKYGCDVNDDNEGTFSVFNVSIDGSGVITLVQDVTEGNVEFPVIANHIAVFKDTTGTIKDDVTTAIQGGNLQAGLSGTAGYLASFPATAAKGSLRVTGVANTGDTVTTISNAAMGQASVISIPDPGAATAEFILSDISGTQHITSGGFQVDAGIISSGLAAGGFVGEFDAYPTTTASGVFSFRAAVNASGDFDTVISNGTAIGQDQVVSVPDSGAATANFILSASAASSQSISSGLSITGDNNVQTSGGGQFIAGADAAKGFFRSYPTTTASGYLEFEAIDNSVDFNTTVNNAATVGQDQVITIPDSGAATANFLLDTGAANIIAHQEFVGISNVLTFGTGTWTVTRIAQGNYVSRHTPGDETSIIGIDITPMIRVAASKGFRLDSFDYIYAIAADALEAHTAVLDLITYADNSAVAVTSVPVTGALATATQGNPYVTNVAVDTPAFDVTADTKYVLEVTVDNSASSEYDFYGVMLRFSQTIG